MERKGNRPARKEAKLHRLLIRQTIEQEITEATELTGPLRFLCYLLFGATKIETE